MTAVIDLPCVSLGQVPSNCLRFATPKAGLDASLHSAAFRSRPPDRQAGHSEFNSSILDRHSLSGIVLCAVIGWAVRFGI